MSKSWLALMLPGRYNRGMKPFAPCRTVLLLAGACALAVFSGCTSAKPEARVQPTVTTTAEPEPEPPTKTRTPAIPAVARTKAVNPLDAERAMGYLNQICALGPRPSGSGGMKQQQALLTKHFESLGAKVSQQEFTMPHPISGKGVPCANLVIQFHPERKERILFCAHYDTRPLPDQDPNPRRRREGVFIGANDGASGAAVLMEMANHLAEADVKVGVDMVMFDAEEMVYENDFSRKGDYFWGSTYFADQYKKNPPEYRYRWGVLLDMVGDAELQILQEKNSMAYARPLVLDIWKTAARLGVDEFVPRTKRRRGGEVDIRDDHLPLNQLARIPSCDIIDADYPNVPFGMSGSYWHTEQDLPKHCSGESMAKVGWVLLEWLKAQPAVAE